MLASGTGGHVESVTEVCDDENDMCFGFFKAFGHDAGVYGVVGREQKVSCATCQEQHTRSSPMGPAEQDEGGSLDENN